MALLRAVIYCRCSTEEESQADALLSQVSESEACVRERGWILADRYVEAKSGTSTKGRDEYNRLFEDLRSDRFDVIVIKSQDRLMRNVKDWYLFLDRMLSHGKRLFMYIEQKFYTADDALITGIKAILAEEYSRELSKKINNAHRNRQKNGGKAMLNSRAFGFCKLPDGSVKVVEEEAGIIRKIYEYSAAGYGSRRIAKLFLEQGYVKRTGNALTSTCVGRIIRNPLYKGTMVMNRLHYDFETKKTVKVPGEQWIYREGAVPAIVDKDLWERANRAMTGRAPDSLRDRIGADETKTGRCGLSGKLVCSRCQKPYYRTQRHGCGEKGGRVIEWKCSTYLERGRRKQDRGFSEGCDGIHLNEEILFGLLEQVSGLYCDFMRLDPERIGERALRIFAKVLGAVPAGREWEKAEREEKRLEGQKDFLLTKLLEGVISDRDYRKRRDWLDREMERVKAQKEELRQREGGGLEKRLEKIKDRLENGGIKRAATAGMLEDIKEIRVHEWQVEVCFRRRGQAEDMAKGFTLWADYPFGPETVKGRYLDRRRIVELLKEEPATTAAKLAREMGRSAYMVRNRMEELSKGGYIRFHGRGGRGRWEVLKELPDKEGYYGGS